MQQVTHNKMVQSRQTRDQQLAALGISPQAARIARRIQQACVEPMNGRLFMITNQGGGVWQLVELTSGKVEVVK